MNKSSLLRRKTIENILKEVDAIHDGLSLKRNLTVIDLTALGIAAIVGAGIFSTIGMAAANGGPAISLLFVFTAVACGFSALCYAQFASAIPISGSAYTYSYASFGELIAWIIGWDLIMEYAVGNIAVAISWSGYFTGLMHGLGFHIPEYLTIDYYSAANGFKHLSETQGIASLHNILSVYLNAYTAWMTAPRIFGMRLIANIPAFGVTAFITYLVFVGIRESKIAGNIMVLIKISILMVVIGIGATYVNPANWSPFAPNGLAGVLKGVSGVFFAYIGFDAISTTAEECRNPRKDLPRAIIYALVICTVLYIIVSIVLTGMVNYSELGVNDPLAYVFQKLGLNRLSGLIAFSAVIAMASVLLVFQVGQPRIWMSMSRDGLLPKAFSKVHKRYKTPYFSTIVTGIMVSVPSLFLNITEVTDLTSIGTLFAFVLVCGGVLILDGKERLPKFSKLQKSENHSTFKIKYLNSRYYLLPLWAIVLIILFYLNSEGVINFFNFNSTFNIQHSALTKLPLLFFIIFSIIFTFYSIRNQLSLIPVLGLLTNLYLMTELGITNWLRFIIWLVVGLIIYFTYGFSHSKLRS